MTAPLPAQTPAARLYDVRYSRFTGDREPRWRSVLALARSSGGRALGLRRGAGAKVWPFLLLASAYLPVVVAVGLPLLVPDVLTPGEILTYDQLLGVLTLVVVAFTATTIPSLLTRERRDRVLSLYFSTALSTGEYVLGKVLAALGLLSLVALLPLVALWAGTIVTADAPLEQLRSDAGDLPSLLLGGLVVTTCFAAMGLVAGALTGKRVFAVGGLLAVLLVTPLLSGLVSELQDDTDWLALDLANVAQWAAGTVVPGPVAEDRPASGLLWAVSAAVVVVAAVVLAVRYRRAEQA